MNNLSCRFVFTLIAVIAFGGCGGGSTDDSNGVQPPDPLPADGPPDPQPVGGIGRTGFALGPVATFGSIVVNGVRYDTDGATFSVNGVAGSQADLKVGQVVLVTGTIDSNGTSGTADSVAFDDVVTGPVESIDSAGSTLIVLGQTVHVTPETSFDDSFNPASLDGVSVGQIVEVSGQFDANEDIAATRIEPKPQGTMFEVHGSVSNLDAANSRFDLNSLTVDYSAAVLDNFPSGQISDGDFVEAKGIALSPTGELLASSVELDSLIPDTADGDRVEIEGFITRFVSSTDFDVAGLTVTTNGSTLFVGGDANDLGLNLKVEVEGDIDSTGLLVATKVDIRRAKAVRATALVDSVDAAGYSIVLLGITVSVDASTRLEDKSDADVEPLTLSDVNSGDYVEVRGSEFPAGSGEILATIFEREDQDDETELQGFVESTANPSFSILGVTIETNGTTIFRDENDALLSAAEFFDQLAINDLVKAEGVESSDRTIVAEEVEFEVED